MENVRSQTSTRHPKDSYSLPNIDKLVRYKLISFIDTYYGYNQIHMHKSYRSKKIFFKEHSSYTTSLPFDLKNVDATYHIIMNKIFEDEFNEMLEVYMDEMIIKSNEEQLYKGYITSVFIVSNNIT